MKLSIYFYFPFPYILLDSIYVNFSCPFYVLIVYYFLYICVRMHFFNNFFLSLFLSSHLLASTFTARMAALLHRTSPTFKTNEGYAVCVLPLWQTSRKMCLDFKPGQDNYRHLMEFSHSQTEREAHRRNRVMQMKLGSSLAEICLQQRSSVQLLELEQSRHVTSSNKCHSIT